MTAVTAWRTDEPCPVCATGLILRDDGTSAPSFECRLCGWSDTWTADQLVLAAPGAEARQASAWLLAEYERNAAALGNGLSGRLADEDQEQRFLRIKPPGPIFTVKEG